MDAVASLREKRSGTRRQPHDSFKHSRNSEKKTCGFCLLPARAFFMGVVSPSPTGTSKGRITSRSRR